MRHIPFCLVAGIVVLVLACSMVSPPAAEARQPQGVPPTNTAGKGIAAQSSTSCKEIHGLLGQYFMSPDFTNLYTMRIDRQVNFPKWSDPIMEGFPLYQKSFKWTGKLRIDTPGLYQFKVEINSAQWDGETLAFLYLTPFDQVLSVAYPGCCGDKVQSKESDPIRFSANEVGLHDLRLTVTTGRLAKNWQNSLNHLDRVTSVRMLWKTPSNDSYVVIPEEVLLACSRPYDYLLQELDEILASSRSRLAQKPVWSELQSIRAFLEFNIEKDPWAKLDNLLNAHYEELDVPSRGTLEAFSKHLKAYEMTH